MKEHKEIDIICKCKSTIRLTAIQYDDFDMGIMGTLNCPTCKTILMPSNRRIKDIKEKEIEVEGKDRGWS